MTIKLNRSAALMLLLGLMTAGCGGKQVEPVSEPVSDITRPPQMVKKERQVEEERDPDEAISYDEWRNRRQAELEADEEPESP